MAALQSDLLSALAWFNFGVFWHKEGNSNAALLAFLMAGLLEHRDTEAWCNATLIAIATEEREGMLVLVVRAAYDTLGATFLETFAAFRDRQEPGFPADEVMAAVERTVRKVVKEQPGFDLRFLMDDGSYLTLPVQCPPRRSPSYS